MSETGADVNISFEEALKKIQAAVKRLEAADVTLEESLKVYQDGISYVRTCQERLKAAEAVLTKLSVETK